MHVYFTTFLFFHFCLFPFCFFVLWYFVPLVLFFSSCLCGHTSSFLVTILSLPTFLPLLSYINHSGKPVISRSPQLSALSLHSSSCFSPTFPRYWPNTLAANGEPDGHIHLSKRQFCYRNWGSRLCQSLPNPAVLPVHRVTLQQIRPHPAPWGCSGPVSISGQYPQGPKVRKTMFSLLMIPFVVPPALLSLLSLRARSAKFIIYEPSLYKKYKSFHLQC